MPSIMRYDDNQEPSSPEPPARYSPDSRFGGENRGPRGNGAPDKELARTRNAISAAQIMALVSLVIGGVVLGAVALGFAVYGYRRASGARGSQRADLQDALERSARIALIASIVALALNAAALVMVYPIIMDMLQSGDYASLFGSQTSPQPQGNSTWG